MGSGSKSQLIRVKFAEPLSILHLQPFACLNLIVKMFRLIIQNHYLAMMCWPWTKGLLRPESPNSYTYCVPVATLTVLWTSHAFLEVLDSCIG